MKHNKITQNISIKNFRTIQCELNQQLIINTKEISRDST